MDTLSLTHKNGIRMQDLLQIFFLHGDQHQTYTPETNKKWQRYPVRKCQLNLETRNCADPRLRGFNDREGDRVTISVDLGFGYCCVCVVNLM